MYKLQVQTISPSDFSQFFVILLSVFVCVCVLKTDVEVETKWVLFELKPSPLHLSFREV